MGAGLTSQLILDDVKARRERRIAEGREWGIADAEWGGVETPWQGGWVGGNLAVWGVPGSSRAEPQKVTGCPVPLSGPGAF